MLRNYFPAALTPLFFCALSAQANNQSIAIQYSVKPSELNQQVVTTDANLFTGTAAANETKLNSGLDLALQNKLVAMAIEYKLQSSFKEDTAVGGDNFSHTIGSSIHSSQLNQLLDIDSGVKTESLVSKNGDAYRYRIQPSMKKTIKDVADMHFNYDYELKKDSEQAAAQEKKTYSLGLNGAVQSGRLVWKSDYLAASEFSNKKIQTKGIEQLTLQSQYQIASMLKLGLSNDIKAISQFSSGRENAVNTERTSVANIGWAPLSNLSIGYSVNQLNKSLSDELQTTQSGSMSWAPKNTLNLTVNYDDRDSFLNKSLSWSPISKLQLAIDQKQNFLGKSASWKYSNKLTIALNYNEKFFDRTMSWAPNNKVKLDLNFNEKFIDRSIYWMPQDHMEFSISYGDKLSKGQQALLLSTNIDLDKILYDFR